jgi:hypothetical protein
MGRHSVSSPFPTRHRQMQPEANKSKRSDIIDHEPSCGDVNKMLLGSFVEEYDEDDEDGSPSWGGTAQSMDSPQRLASPVRTSPFQGFSLPDQAPQMSLPTINTHIPPIRPQTRQNTLSMSSSRGG